MLVFVRHSNVILVHIHADSKPFNNFTKNLIFYFKAYFKLVM